MFVKKLISNKIKFLSLILFILLAGCMVNSPLYNQTQGNIADVTERISTARNKIDASPVKEPVLLVNEGDYVDRTPIDIAKQPLWLRNHIVIRGDDLPFIYYSRVIASGGGSTILTRYQAGLDPTTRISMNYSGTVKGALDILAAKAGDVYSVNGNNIYWQAFITKTFDIAFMPGSSDYLMGKAQGTGSVTSAIGSAAVSAIADDSAAAQYSNLKGTLSVWKDLENTIKQLLSPEGKVLVSESTTSVTVRDKPSNVDLVSKYITNFNCNLSKQVLIKVQILEIKLSSDYVYGINWNVVQNAFGHSNFILNANYGTPVSITPLGAAGGPALLGLQSTATSTTDPTGTTSTGITALINALTQQGKVSVVTEPRVVCTNNQVGVIRIVNQEGYLASIQNSTIAGSTAASGTITSQLTPGSLITGFTLYILPKIMGNDVYLQVNADISANLGFKTFPTTAASSTTASQIQLPNVTQKQFNQRSVISSGSTLILSGFRQISNTANSIQLFGSQALGGKGSLQSDTETVVLITPIILHGSA